MPKNIKAKLSKDLLNNIQLNNVQIRKNFHSEKYPKVKNIPKKNLFQSRHLVGRAN